MKIRLRQVGSSLVKENPRDWDLLLFIPDDVFSKLYLEPKRFLEEGKTGAWSSERWDWAKDCVEIGRTLANISNKNIDFKIFPESLEVI
jgi:hypothetical protein